LIVTKLGKFRISLLSNNLVRVIMNDNDKAARVVGATAGAATVTGIALAAEGASAAAMTSALATTGSLVGGGMAAGIGVAVAAPLAVGAAAYGLYKWLKD
jgi:hypothetical protein